MFMLMTKFDIQIITSKAKEYLQLRCVDELKKLRQRLAKEEEKERLLAE
jgi:hypothetical protein